MGGLGRQSTFADFSQTDKTLESDGVLARNECKSTEIQSQLINPFVTFADVVETVKSVTQVEICLVIYPM